MLGLEKFDFFAILDALSKSRDESGAQNELTKKHGKTPLQSRFTLLKNKLFPAKFSFYKIQKKNLAGKNTLQKSEFYFAKE
jgi:hypothetical protein